METSEMVMYIVLSIIFILPFVVVLFVLLSGLVKNKIDNAVGDESGWLGWIIAILIIGAIFYVIATTDNREPEYRHSYNIENRTHTV
jgi:Mn2+/Fe2+ NRAMP family transporter